MDELAKERYDLAVERIREIREEKTVAEPYLDFFTKTAGFLEEMIRLRDRVEAGEMKKTVPGRAAPGKYAVLSGYSAGELPDFLCKSGLCGKDAGRRFRRFIKFSVYRTSRNDRVCLGAEKLGFSGGTGTVFAGVQRV